MKVSLYDDTCCMTHIAKRKKKCVIKHYVYVCLHVGTLWVMQCVPPYKPTVCLTYIYKLKSFLPMRQEFVLFSVVLENSVLPMG